LFALAAHCETHYWLNRAEKQSNGFIITEALDKQDWEWMQQRTSARR
jgi:hypothetical protein